MKINIIMVDNIMDFLHFYEKYQLDNNGNYAYQDHEMNAANAPDNVVETNATANNFNPADHDYNDSELHLNKRALNENTTSLNSTVFNNTTISSSDATNSSSPLALRENNYALPIAYTLESLLIAGTVVLSHSYGDYYTVAGGALKGFKPFKLMGSMTQLGILAATPYINQVIADEIGTAEANPSATTTLIIAGMYYITKIIQARIIAINKLPDLQSPNEVVTSTLNNGKDIGNVGNELTNIIQGNIQPSNPVNLEQRP